MVRIKAHWPIDEQEKAKQESQTEKDGMRKGRVGRHKPANQGSRMW